MFFNQIALMFTLQIHAPSLDLVLKFLFLIVIAFAQDLDGLGIG